MRRRDCIIGDWSGKQPFGFCRPGVPRNAYCGSSSTARKWYSTPNAETLNPVPNEKSLSSFPRSFWIDSRSLLTILRTSVPRGCHSTPTSWDSPDSTRLYLVSRQVAATSSGRKFRKERVDRKRRLDPSARFPSVLPIFFFLSLLPRVYASSSHCATTSYLTRAINGNSLLSLAKTVISYRLHV